MVIGSTTIKNKYVWIAFGVLGGIILLLIALWIINSSFIEVKILNGGSGEYTFSFLNQTTNKTAQNKTSSNQVKQLVSTDSYEVLAQQDYKSFFAVVKTQHLIANTYIEANLQPENSREFVGNNPESCMNYINAQLVSFQCDGILANALVHIPATSKLPTYVTTTKGQGPAGYNEGFLNIAEGTFVLSQLPQVSENGAKQVLYRVGKNFASTEVIFMPQLDDAKRYMSVPYKTGFIVYSQTFDQILYYPSIKSQGVDITSTKVNTPNTVPVSLDVNGDSILTSYTNKTSSTKKTSSDQTKVFINTNGDVQTFTFNKAYSKVSFCGSKKVCLLGNTVADVYDISSSQNSYLYSLINVVGMQNSSKGFLIANSTGIINVDIDNKTGFISYSFGGYKFNYFVLAPNGYAVSLTNTKDKKVALYVNQTQTDSTNIDKKILELLGLSEVKDVSINGKYITIVPSIPTVKNSAGKTVTDTDKQKQINETINNFINKLGIDNQKFTITNIAN